MRGWKLALDIGGRCDWWEVILQNMWEVGDWTHKQVEGGRLTSKTGGKWEVKVGSYIARYPVLGTF